jgi:hypothetical protein
MQTAEARNGTIQPSESVAPDAVGLATLKLLLAVAERLTACPVAVRVGGELVKSDSPDVVWGDPDFGSGAPYLSPPAILLGVARMVGALACKLTGEVPDLPAQYSDGQWVSLDAQQHWVRWGPGASSTPRVRYPEGCANESA